jgi:ribosomal protein L44E
MSTPYITIKCGACGHTESINKLAWAVSSFPTPCPGCNEDLRKVGERTKRGKTDSQKRSRKQEKRAAKRVGGKVQPGSGAGRAKGDVRAPWHARIECKLTRAKSFGLKLAALEKIEKEALPPELPIFEIEFQGVTPHKRYAVIPGWLLDHFMGLEDE